MLQGLNRIGNMLVPNENYCKFEEWLMPLLDTMLDEQVGALPCCLPASAARARFCGMSLCSRLSMCSRLRLNLSLRYGVDCHHLS